MIRMTPQRRFRVSNRAAMFAALLLVLTSFTGFSGSNNADQQYAESVENANKANEQVATQTSNKRKLNLSLLLIGRG